jgi:Ankyrin repeats (many copies)
MSDSLPKHPDLGQLRRQAKELRDATQRRDPGALARFTGHQSSGPPDRVSLAAAQLVIARELGYSSWPALKAAIDAAAVSRQEVLAFVDASVEGRLRQASDMFRADPGIAAKGLLAAVVLGDAGAVREVLAADPAAAAAIDAERGWPPLLYACYSWWHQIDPSRAPQLAEVVRVLLDAGASPDTNDGGRPRYRSALKGSVEANNPDMTEALLEAGANPDPGEPIAEAIGHRGHRCLQLLLSHGARVARTWALGAAVFKDDPVAASLVLGALESGAGSAADAATGELPDAAIHASLPVVDVLLDAGADPQASDDDGMSALRLAVRAGKNDIAQRLRAAGAADDAVDADRYIGACLNGDRRAAEELLAAHPGLRGRLTDQDRAVIVEATAHPAETVALMLDLGFPPDARNGFGEQPLHRAAYLGNAAVVRLLLDAGAEIDARDSRFDATPLAAATVGSREQAGQPGDWIGTVRQLIEGGASGQGVWIPGKPPSEDVMALLRSYGITPDEPARQQPDDQAADDLTEEPGSAGTGVMADVAAHLEAAYRERDLDLLGSLLHPDVRWTGDCTSKAQVLEWYRGLLADQTVATIRSVEADRDAVVLGLSVGRRAEGAHPAPPQDLWQVFTVDGAQIIDIRVYPDRRSALSRTVNTPEEQDLG